MAAELFEQYLLGASVSDRKMSRNSNSNYWRYGLLRDMKDPKLQLLRSDRAVVIADKFPRSKHHYLVLPVEDIDTIYQLKPEHIPLLEEMKSLGVKMIEGLEDGFKMADFRFGFHMGAKLHRLHLHVISQDFVSNRLRKFEQWNGYNTAYFMPYDDILAELKEKGNIARRPMALIDRLLHTPLVCNQCPDRFGTLEELKAHLDNHWLEKRLEKISLVK